MLWHFLKFAFFVVGNTIDWLQNLDSLKESMRLASSYNWSDLDLSQFQGTKKSKYTMLWLISW